MNNKNNHIIAKSAYFGEGDDIVLKINVEARAKQAAGENVINASIGMLLDEDLHLATFDVVQNELKTNLNKDSYIYPSVSGGRDFSQALLSWLIPDGLGNELNAKVVATPGGAGAISLALRSYAEVKASVLIPCPGWANYPALVKQVGANPVSYPLFQGDHFALDELRILATKIAQTEGRLVLIINDPAQNPSGYSLSEVELDQLINLCNNIAQDYPITIIFDIAYLDYENEDILIFKKLHCFQANIMPLFCFSASKTFAIYGLRLGALIAISKDKNELDLFYQASLASARAIWSCANHHALNSLNSVLLNNKLAQLLRNDLIIKRKLLKERAFLFIREAKALGLKMLPYKSGFFVSIICPNAKHIASVLRNMNIYLLPIGDDYLRVAFSSLNLAKIKGLAHIIDNTIREENL